MSTKNSYRNQNLVIRVGGCIYILYARFLIPYVNVHLDYSGGIGQIHEW